MFSKSFMEFLINYNDKTEKEDDNHIEEIEFKSAKVTQAAQVVVASIKETF